MSHPNFFHGLVGGGSFAPVPAKSKWDEARETIALWEKLDPKAKYVVLILDGEKDIVMDCHGGTIKPSDLAGLCFAAATMAVDA
jgi:hypothetical protein